MYLLWIIGAIAVIFVICLLIGNFGSREVTGKRYLLRELGRRGIVGVPDPCIDELVKIAKGSATAAMMSGKGKSAQATDFKQALDRTVDLIVEWRQDKNSVPRVYALHREVLERYKV